MPFRYALVGAGRMGGNHARALLAEPELELAAVVEPSDDSWARLALDVPRFRVLGDLIEEGGFDAALVAVPTRLHLEVVSALVEARVPVLCEKPCGLTSAETRELARIAEDFGTLLRVAYWRRHVPALRGLRERIHTGELGQISFVLCSQWDEAPPPAAFRDPASSGGITVDMGVHEFDVSRWLTGAELAEICGYASSVSYDPPIPGDPESASFAGVLTNGGTLLVTLGRRHVHGEFHRVQVIGTEGAEAAEAAGPPSFEEKLLRALGAQALDFARGGEDCATPLDAVAALAAAERAAASISRRSHDW